MGGTLFVSVLGWSGTGKTTLVERAIAECRRRGLGVAAAKRARHDPDAAPEAKDSSRFLAAGAAASLYLGDRGLALFAPPPEREDRAFYEAILPPASIVFLEGALVEGSLLVLVAGGARSAGELKRPAEEVDLLICERELPGAGRPRLGRLSPDEVGAFVDLLEAQRGK